MRRILTLIMITVMLTGCAAVTSVINLVPSFSDPNQSARITDVRLAVDQIDCHQPQLPQALRVQQDLRWFELYSVSKGRQNDVIKIIAPMQETTVDWVKRSREQQGTVAYCEIKKKILQSQGELAARAILGRF